VVAADGGVGGEGQEELRYDGLCHRTVPERMGAKCRGPLDRWEMRGLPPTHTRAPRTNVVTATPRKALDGKAPQRLLVVVIPRDAPEGGEAGLEVEEEGVGLRR